VPYRLSRVVRTASSEIYLAWQEETRVAQIDLHYTPDVIHATVVLERDFDKEAVDELVRQIDRDVVASYLQDFERDNLLVSVFRGDEVVTYCDEDREDDEDEGPEW
jgi:hypothetical protein